MHFSWVPVPKKWCKEYWITSSGLYNRRATLNLGNQTVLFTYFCFKNFYWSIVTLQHWVSFYCTAHWTSHTNNAHLSIALEGDIIFILLDIHLPFAPEGTLSPSTKAIHYLNIISNSLKQQEQGQCLTHSLQKSETKGELSPHDNVCQTCLLLFFHSLCLFLLKHTTYSSIYQGQTLSGE